MLHGVYPEVQNRCFTSFSMTSEGFSMTAEGFQDDGEGLRMTSAEH